jgi:hypothetical protein
MLAGQPVAAVAAAAGEKVAAVAGAAGEKAAAVATVAVDNIDMELELGILKVR